MRYRFIPLFIVLLTLLSGCQSATQLSVIGFNVESGDADPNYIANQYIKPIRGVDLWGFSEVQNQSWADRFESAIEINNQADFKSLLGTTGNADKLAIVYNSNQLNLIKKEELNQINIGGSVRAALVGHFQVKSTGQEFLFMVNHLYRTNDRSRHEQARLLNRWAQKQTLPIIAVGDYNFDWDVKNGDSKRDPGYDLLTENDVFTWVRPQEIIATHCSTRYNTVLDFVFISSRPKPISASSKILYPEADYCPDTPQKSDHRPVQATFVLPKVQP
ncbi:endonuclease/exonuclease/phosphatase family protein [Capilliphycus salinus ALCB114379]|uniref:endonuclease/exonuclease/phosphatase family protein n=1 Tax=Capilliphycus salinus TaxID=2768948 RepID=UPI0039A622B2